MANSYLGRRTRKRDGGRREAGGEKGREGSRREREGPDRRRHIRELLLSLVLGGLDSVVPSREGKKGRNENYGKMRGETKRRRGAMEQRG